MPTAGSATYTGGTAGYVTAGGDYFLAESDFEAVANFDDATIAVASTGTWGTDIEGGHENATTLPGLDFNGSGNIDGAGFNVVITNGYGAGEVDGRFYGPNAEELGGIFHASGSGVDYFGSFGAQR